MDLTQTARDLRGGTTAKAGELGATGDADWMATQASDRPHRLPIAPEPDAPTAPEDQAASTETPSPPRPRRRPSPSRRRRPVARVVAPPSRAGTRSCSEGPRSRFPARLPSVLTPQTLRRRQHDLLRHRRHRLHRPPPRPELLANREGEIALLARPACRGASSPSSAPGGAANRVSVVPGDLEVPCSASPRTGSRRPGQGRPLLPRRGPLRQDRLRRAQRAVERRRDTLSSGRRRASTSGSSTTCPPWRSRATTKASSTRRCSTRGRSSRPPTTGPSSSPSGSCGRSPRSRGRVYRPSIVVGHSETGEMDKADGPLLLLPAVQAAPRHPPAVAAGARRRPRGHQRRARRLRRLGDGPHRSPARARRAGVPPRQPGPAADRRRGQRVRERRQGSRFTVPLDRRLTGLLPANLPPKALRLSPAQPFAALRETIGRVGVPPEVLGHVSFLSQFAARRLLRRAARLRHLPLPTWTATPRAVEPTGRTTSTRTPRGTTKASARPSAARRSSSPAPPRSDARPR